MKQVALPLLGALLLHDAHASVQEAVSGVAPATAIKQPEAALPAQPVAGKKIAGRKGKKLAVRNKKPVPAVSEKPEGAAVEVLPEPSEQAVQVKGVRG